MRMIRRRAIALDGDIGEHVVDRACVVTPDEIASSTAHDGAFRIAPIVHVVTCAGALTVLWSFFGTFSAFMEWMNSL